MQRATNYHGVDDSSQEEHHSPWKPNLNGYLSGELKSLTFPDVAGIDAAIDLLWSPKLRGMPFDLAGGDSLIVPAQGVHFFTDEGLVFAENDLLSRDELTAEELNELRQHGPF